MTDITGAERGFSVEIESKRYVKSISISNESQDRVLFEGDLGELEELSMIDGEVLMIRGTHGKIRIDLSENELRKMLAKPNASGSLSSEVGSYTSTKKKEMKRSEA